MMMINTAHNKNQEFKKFKRSTQERSIFLKATHKYTCGT